MPEAKKIGEIKKRDHSAQNVVGEVMTKFKQYDLDKLDIPRAARPPVDGNHQGKHGYTLKQDSGAVTVCTATVSYQKNALHDTTISWNSDNLSPRHSRPLLKTKAYVVKRTSASDSEKENLQRGQITWKKFGGPGDAWKVAMERAGWAS